MLIKIPSICRRQNLSILWTNMNTWLMMIDEILTQKIHVNLYYEYNCSMLPTQFIKSLNQNHFFKHVYFGFFFEGYALFFLYFFFCIIYNCVIILIHSWFFSLHNRKNKKQIRYRLFFRNFRVGGKDYTHKIPFYLFLKHSCSVLFFKGLTTIFWFLNLDYFFFDNFLLFLIGITITGVPIVSTRIII